MKPLLRISGLLLGFLLFLSISVNGRPVFDHIYDVISPGTKYAQNLTENFFQKSFSTTRTYSQKLFDNSVPSDRVKSKLAGTLKTAAGEPAEKISVQEKEQLDDLIKNHRR